MSTLPEVIRVKRKRDETSAPVDFLELEPKRHCSVSGGDSWVYQRQGYAEGTGQTTVSSPAEQQRRFLLSRRPAGASSSGKRPRESVVFVECTSPTTTKKPRLEIAEEHSQHIARVKKIDPTAAAATAAGASASVAAAAPVEKQPRAPPKRPLPLPQDYGFDEDAYQRALARWNQDEFVRGCVEWSDRCREAKLDGEKATAASNKQKAATITPDGPNQGGPAGVTTGTASSQKRSLRFKPKKPSQRYAERHPEVVTDTHSNKSDAARGNSSAHAPSSSDHPSAVEGGGDEMDIDGDGDVSDGGSSSTRSSEWVVDVYERVPASKIVGKKHNIGLIVFEDSKDQEFFYGPEGDSEDDAPGDDGNDSNAEDHYENEYPEEESSGDEDDRDPDEALYNYYANDDDGEDGEEFEEFGAGSHRDDYIVDGETDAQMLRKLRRWQAMREMENPDDDFNE